MSFVDLHLSEVAQMVNYGFFGDIDVAVIEASALAPDGRVWLTSGIGNAPTWLLRAKKVIIELNHYHDPRVAELADIVIPGAPPRRNSVSIFHAMDRVGTRYVQIDPKRLSPSWKPTCLTPVICWISKIPCASRLPITWSRSYCRKWRMGVFRRNFCRCKVAWAISIMR